MATIPLDDDRPIGGDPDDLARILRMVPGDRRGRLLPGYQDARDAGHDRDPRRRWHAGDARWPCHARP
jgi:hypothetical protein